MNLKQIIILLTIFFLITGILVCAFLNEELPLKDKFIQKFHITDPFGNTIVDGKYVNFDAFYLYHGATFMVTIREDGTVIKRMLDHDAKTVKIEINPLYFTKPEGASETYILNVMLPLGAQHIQREHFEPKIILPSGLTYTDPYTGEKTDEFYNVIFVKLVICDPDTHEPLQTYTITGPKPEHMDVIRHHEPDFDWKKYLDELERKE